MRKTILVVLLLASMLLISCRPEIGPGQAIAGASGPVLNYDLANYPFNVAGPDFLGWSNPLPVYLYADSTKYNVEGQSIAAQVEADFCKDTPLDQQCAYTFSPVFVTTPTTKFIAIGTCAEAHIQNLLDADTCNALVPGKAVIQYVAEKQLVVAGGTEDDAKAAINILIMHNSWELSGYYSDILNLDHLLAASRIINNIPDYKTVFYFEQGQNVVINPLYLPEESIADFFAGNLDKITRIYLFDTATNKYTHVYNANAPSNLDIFAETDKVYVVQASQDFMVTRAGAIPTAYLAAEYALPVPPEKLISAFVTGAAVSAITGSAVAAQTAAPDTRPIYRCNLNFHGVIDHFLSFDPTCGGYAVDGLIGHLYQSSAADRVAIYQCHRQQRYESRTYTDHFTSTDPGCEGASLLGYAPATATADTITFYQCRYDPSDVREGKFDHMLSSQVGCEGYHNLGTAFYFLKEEKLAMPPWDNGHTCTQDSDCKSDFCENNACAPQVVPIYRCWLNFHGVMDHFMTRNPTCGGPYTPDGQMGYLLAKQKPNAVPIYQCIYSQRHDERTYNDHFLAANACPTDSTQESLLGYGLPQATEDTITLYQCRRDPRDVREGKFDHMVSASAGCEGYTNIGTEFYFLKTDQVPAAITLPQMTPVYRCWLNFHGVMDHFVSETQGCGGYTLDNLLGYLLIDKKPNSIPIYECTYSQRHDERTYNDHFLAANTCPTDSTSSRLIGYAAPQASDDTTTLYQCSREPRDVREGKFDHMVSPNAGCESDQYRNLGIMFHFFKTAQVPATIPAPGPADVYRCWLNFHGVPDHFLSYDSNCGGHNVDGLIGKAYPTEQPNTIPIYQCYRQTHEEDRLYKDHFLAANACPTDSGVFTESLIGYLPSSAVKGTTTYYRCWNYPDSIHNGRWDHMISTQINCEGWRNEGIEFYFLGEAPLMPMLTAPGGTCTQTSECQTGYECIESICTRKVPLYACDWTFLDTSASCIDFFTGTPASSSVQIGYALDPAVTNVPGTELLGTCRDEATGDYSFGLQTYPNVIPCPSGYGFHALGYLFRTQKAGTVPLRLCSDYDFNYHIVSANAICPSNYPLGSTPASLFIFPEPYCGNGITEPPETCDDGNLVNGDGCDYNCQLEGVAPGYCGDGTVQASLGEQCEPPNTATCDANCQTITPVPPPIIPGVPPLVPPPTPPTLPPFPHQFYGNVINGIAGMPILATLGGMNFNTAADTNIQYGYTPVFLITGTTNGALISFYVNNTFDQTHAFQQGALTRLDLTYTPGGAPPTGPTCSDNILNQDETDIDCGGTVCPKCGLNKVCLQNTDCKSSYYCKNGLCKPKPVAGGGGGGGGVSLGKYVTTAQELYGMPTPTTGAECTDDWICDEWGPCVDGMQARECFLNDYPECTLQLEKPETTQACEMPVPEYVPPPAPTCFDGIKNQDETFTDCGGSICKPCDPNLPCRIDRDCVTSYCEPITELCSWPPVVEVPKPTSLWLIWLIVFLAAVGGIGGIIAAIVLSKRKEELPDHSLKDLRKYIETYKKKGVPTEKIRQKIIQQGWKKEVVDQVLK